MDSPTTKLWIKRSLTPNGEFYVLTQSNGNNKSANIQKSVKVSIPLEKLGELNKLWNPNYKDDSKEKAKSPKSLENIVEEIKRRQAVRETKYYPYLVNHHLKRKRAGRERKSKKKFFLQKMKNKDGASLKKIHHKKELIKKYSISRKNNTTSSNDRRGTNTTSESSVMHRFFTGGKHGNVSTSLKDNVEKDTPPLIVDENPTSEKRKSLNSSSVATSGEMNKQNGAVFSPKASIIEALCSSQNKPIGKHNLPTVYISKPNGRKATPLKSISKDQVGENSNEISNSNNEYPNIIAPQGVIDQNIEIQISQPVIEHIIVIGEDETTNNNQQQFSVAASDATKPESANKNNVNKPTVNRNELNQDESSHRTPTLAVHSQLNNNQTNHTNERFKASLQSNNIKHPIPNPTPPRPPRPSNRAQIDESTNNNEAPLNKVWTRPMIFNENQPVRSKPPPYDNYVHNRTPMPQARPHSRKYPVQNPNNQPYVIPANMLHIHQMSRHFMNPNQNFICDQVPTPIPRCTLPNDPNALNMPVPQNRGMFNLPPNVTELSQASKVSTHVFNDPVAQIPNTYTPRMLNRPLNTPATDRPHSVLISMLPQNNPNVTRYEKVVQERPISMTPQTQYLRNETPRVQQNRFSSNNATSTNGQVRSNTALPRCINTPVIPNQIERLQPNITPTLQQNNVTFQNPNNYKFNQSMTPRPTNLQSNNTHVLQNNQTSQNNIQNNSIYPNNVNNQNFVSQQNQNYSTFNQRPNSLNIVPTMQRPIITSNVSVNTTTQLQNNSQNQQILNQPTYHHQSVFSSNSKNMGQNNVLHIPSSSNSQMKSTQLTKTTSNEPVASTSGNQSDSKYESLQYNIITTLNSILCEIKDENRRQNLFHEIKSMLTSSTNESAESSADAKDYEIKNELLAIKLQLNEFLLHQKFASRTETKCTNFEAKKTNETIDIKKLIALMLQWLNKEITKEPEIIIIDDDEMQIKTEAEETTNDKSDTITEKGKDLTQNDLNENDLSDQEEGNINKTNKTTHTFRLNQAQPFRKRNHKCKPKTTITCNMFVLNDKVDTENEIENTFSDHSSEDDQNFNKDSNKRMRKNSHKPNNNEFNNLENNNNGDEASPSCSNEQLNNETHSNVNSCEPNTQCANNTNFPKNKMRNKCGKCKIQRLRHKRLKKRSHPLSKNLNRTAIQRKELHEFVNSLSENRNLFNTNDQLATPQVFQNNERQVFQNNEHQQNENGTIENHTIRGQYNRERTMADTSTDKDFGLQSTDKSFPKNSDIYKERKHVTFRRTVDYEKEKKVSEENHSLKDEHKAKHTSKVSQDSKNYKNPTFHKTVDDYQTRRKINKEHTHGDKHKAESTSNVSQDAKNYKNPIFKQIVEDYQKRRQLSKEKDTLEDKDKAERILNANIPKSTNWTPTNSTGENSNKTHLKTNNAESKDKHNNPTFGGIDDFSSYRFVYKQMCSFWKVGNLSPRAYVHEISLLNLHEQIPNMFKNFYLYVTKRQIINENLPISFRTFMELLNAGGLRDCIDDYNQYMVLRNQNTAA